MGQATFRFYSGLQSFLGKNADSGSIVHSFVVPGSVKDAIEACGVPHVEVDLILINGEPAEFGARISDGDLISVYPRFMTLDVSTVTRVRPVRPAGPRFVLDGHLSKLAGYLRLLGFDTVCVPHAADHDLVRTSVRERRVLLTRDVGLLKHAALIHGAFVRATAPREQLREIVGRYALHTQIQPFTRCMRCNGKLAPTDPQDVTDEVPPGTRHRFDGFCRCESCRQIYWRGAHYPRLAEIIEDARLATG